MQNSEKKFKGNKKELQKEFQVLDMRLNQKLQRRFKITTVLIVGDDEEIQKFYKKFLKLSGFQVVGIANNGEEVVNMFKTLSEKPDIILMDHRMPLKKGIKTINNTLQINNYSKIIFFSSDLTVKEETLFGGAFAFLNESASYKKLIKVIKKALQYKYNFFNQIR